MLATTDQRKFENKRNFIFLFNITPTQFLLSRRSTTLFELTAARKLNEISSALDTSRLVEDSNNLIQLYNHVWGDLISLYFKEDGKVFINGTNVTTLHSHCKAVGIQI